MSLKELLAKQQADKAKSNEIDNKKKNSFKLNFGGKSAPKSDGEGEDKTNSSVPLTPPSDEDDVKSSPSPTLTDINHESQPDKLQEETTAKFKSALQLLADNIDDKEIVGDCIRNVLGMLKEHDFLEDILRPEDCGMMVRGMREGYGVVIQKKQSKQRKKTASAQEVDKVLEDLANLDIGDLS